MKPQIHWLAVLLLAVLSAHAFAAEEQATTITVQRLCEGCAKKIAGKIQKLPEVSVVKTDVEAKTITITPKPKKALSARALWEIVEKGGEKPVKLQGPNGTFTEKPKS